LNSLLRIAVVSGTALAAALAASVATSGSSYAAGIPRQAVISHGTAAATEQPSTTTAAGTAEDSSGQQAPSSSSNFTSPDALSQLAALGAPSDILGQFTNFDAPPSPLAKRIATNCVNKSFSGGAVKLYGCDNTYKVGSTGGTWYLEDKFKASLESYGDPITGLKFGPTYGVIGENQINDWSPADTSPFGSCATVTSSLTYMGTGISISQPACPETWGLYSVGKYHFTTKWTGPRDGVNNQSRETTGVDSVIDGPTGDPYPSVLWEVWWIT
jgi:hypothetical protein